MPGGLTFYFKIQHGVVEMGISRRGNFVLGPGCEPGNEDILPDAEAEWVGQWEPKIQRSHTVQNPQVIAGLPAEMEVVISLPPERALRIKFVA
jgi:hypothetical protein